MTDFLLELRSEEIPARMQLKAKDDLVRLFTDALTKSGLAADAIEAFATPRRLALIAKDLPLETAASSEETKGPKVGAPPQAMEGFLRKTGLTQDQLVERDGVYFAIAEKPGRKTADVLAEAIPAIIRAFPWPKSQRWGAASVSTESLRWVRPLQGIIALLGDDVVDCEIDGIVSGRTTMGHRFHSSGPIEIANADSYVEALRAAHVIVHFSERTAIIRDGAEAAAKAAGLVLVPDEGLVTENAGLTEWPVPMLGLFDPAFLDVPQEVIQLTARVNQKYFVCNDADGKLANAFVCTANISAHDGGAAIVAGNEKVLAARLSDAKFFWEQDLKVSLEDQAKKLSQITFHEKLGTVADKVERVAKLARWLVEEGIVGTEGTVPTPDLILGQWTVPGGEGQSGASNGTVPMRGQSPASVQLANQAERAARLCKADLVTGMVGEFPELQGIMGGYYARAQGEPDAVADAVRDHYKPVGQGDDVPTAPVTVAVSLADKLDTIFGFFSINEPPTGSKDPYALRRQILGLAAIVLQNEIRLPLEKAIAALGVFHQELYIEFMIECVPGLDKKYEKYANTFDTKSGDAFRYLWQISEEARQEFFESVPEISDEPDDAFVRVNQERRVGAMHRAFAGIRPVFYDWEEIEALFGPSLTFATDRLKVQQREAGVRHDLIDAVFALGGEDDLVRLLARVKALQGFVATQEGTNLLAGYKRAANILKSSGDAKGTVPSGEAAPWTVPDSAVEDSASKGTVPMRGQSPAEVQLLGALDTAEPRATAAIEAEDFAAAMAALASLRAPIDAFFEGVMVNDPDPEKRAFRVGLLTRFRDAVHRVADFSRIEG
jgi:glycyl-tRNA synthetase beta chain